MLRIDYSGLRQFHGVPVFSLYKFHCLILSLLIYTIKKMNNNATSCYKYCNYDHWYTSENRWRN